MTRLALVMIVKNEARSLTRCLASVQQHVDRMIVLDTGSTDDTVAIATSMGAEVHSCAWRNDYAAARNAALDLSDADWNLVLDADEWLDSGADALAPAALPPHKLCAPTHLGCVRLINVEPRAEGDASPLRLPRGGRRDFLPRLLPRGVRYQWRIHEQPVSELPHKRLPIVLGHDGYDPEQLARKKGRNAALLRAAVQEDPLDGYMWYHLGRDLFTYDEPVEAADCMMQAYRLVDPRSPLRMSVVIYTLLLLRLANRHREALALVDAEQDHWDLAPDFFFAVAELYLEWASLNPEIAREELLPVVEGAWLKCLQIGEQPDLIASIEGNGSYRAAANLANFYKILGFPEEAARYAQLSTDMRTTALAA